MVDLPTGEITRRKEKNVDYSENVILSVGDYDAKISQDINRVNRLLLE